MTQTGHRLKWGHFDLLATGQSDLHCRDLKPAFNENVGCENLFLYQPFIIFYSRSSQVCLFSFIVITLLYIPLFSFIVVAPAFRCETGRENAVV